MSGIWTLLVALVVLASIGCEVAAQESPSPVKAEVVAQETLAPAEPKVVLVEHSQEDLLRQVEELEAQIMASKLGITSEEEAIIAFTRAALQIEANRDTIIAYVGRGKGPTMNRVNEVFLKGMSERRAKALAIHLNMASPPFEGMQSLYNRLLLLDVPQALEPIKDGLVQAYSSEIQLAREQTHLESSLVWPRTTKDTLDAQIARAEQFDLYSHTYNFYMRQVTNRWAQVQLFRGQIYTRWVDILQEQGIDATKEGFADLVVTP